MPAKIIIVKNVLFSGFNILHNISVFSDPWLFLCVLVHHQGGGQNLLVQIQAAILPRVLLNHVLSENCAICLIL